MAEQLGLSLPSRAALGREDFFVGPPNALALTLIEDWRNWPDTKLMLNGPRASGKTHLAHVWAAMSGAQILDARSLAEADLTAIATGPLAVEDVHQLAQDAPGQTALFHLHNMMLADRHPLLLTGTGAVASWGLTLPDLVSRLQGTTATTLEPPDDALLAALLVKLFADRQLAPNRRVIDYLLPRMERSFEGATQLVAKLDAESLARQKPITLPLAKDVLGKEADID